MRGFPRLCLLCNTSEFGKCILNVTGNIDREDWARVHGFRHRLLPSPQQAIHSPTMRLSHDKVSIHEGSVEISAKVDCIRRANIFDNRVEHVK